MAGAAASTGIGGGRRRCVWILLAGHGLRRRRQGRRDQGRATSSPNRPCGPGPGWSPHFDDPRTPYVALPGRRSSRRFDDYDHLARVDEWSTGAEARNERRADRTGARQPTRSGAPRRRGLGLGRGLAGTGKTKVLTDRVLRLLLDGAEPERILCLTFTKAAAAEMAQPHRRRSLAAGRAPTTRRSTRSCANCSTGTPDPDELRRARAACSPRVLDAPGGINIHDHPRLLPVAAARFPLEAGVAPHFDGARRARGADAAASRRRRAMRGAAGRDAPPALAERSPRWPAAIGDGRVAELMAETAGRTAAWLLAAHRRRARTAPVRGAASGEMGCVARTTHAGGLAARRPASNGVRRRGPARAPPARWPTAAASGVASAAGAHRRWLAGGRRDRPSASADYAKLFLTDDGEIRASGSSPRPRSRAMPGDRRRRCAARPSGWSRCRPARRRDVGRAHRGAAAARPRHRRALYQRRRTARGCSTTTT